MLNIDKAEKVYLACSYTDLRKSIDGLVMIVQNQFKLDPFYKALFVFCNNQMDKLKILHFDEGVWLYYNRLEANRSQININKTEDIRRLENLNFKFIDLNITYYINLDLNKRTLKNIL